MKSPAFQFYPKDWLSSLKILLMTPEQEGAYVRLLCYCWDSGDCSLPDDDEQLAAMSRLGQGWFNGGSTTLRKCFIPHPGKDGFLTNERLLEEHTKQAAWREKSRLGGKKSAAQRAVNPEDSKGGSTVVQPTPNRPVEPKGNIATASAIASANSTPLTPQSVDLSDFQKIYDAGCAVIPALATATTSPIHQWIAAGCDPELDAIPEIHRLAKNGRNIRSWSYFSGAVTDAKENRLNPPKKGTPHGTSGRPFPNQPNKAERGKAAVMRAAIAGGFAPTP
jgi:hypothetical protein